MIVLNDADLLGNGVQQDALIFFAPILTNVTVNGVTGDLAFIGALAGSKDLWNAPNLPQGYSFLSQMQTRFSGLSLEAYGCLDENDLNLARGSFDVRPVPQPASLTLTALGLAGAVARGRRRAQMR